MKCIHVSPQDAANSLHGTFQTQNIEISFGLFLLLNRIADIYHFYVSFIPADLFQYS